MMDNTRENYKRVSYFKEAIKCALWITAALAAYFSIMYAAGLAAITELRFVNYLIILGGIAISINRLKAKKQTVMSYFEGFGFGVLTSMIAATAFGAFLTIFFALTPDFLAYISSEMAMGELFHPTLPAFYASTECVGAGLVSSLIAMQLHKESKDRSSLEEKKMKNLANA